MLYKIETFMDDEDRQIIVKTPFNSDGTYDYSQSKYITNVTVSSLNGEVAPLMIELENVESLFEAFKQFDTQVQAFLDEASAKATQTIEVDNG